MGHSVVLILNAYSLTYPIATHVYDDHE